MRVGQLPHLINLKLGQVGPADFGEAGGGHVTLTLPDRAPAQVNAQSLVLCAAAPYFIAIG
jgi:hypothetical protein